MMKEFFNPQEFQRFEDGPQQHVSPHSLQHSRGPYDSHNLQSPVIPERPFQNFFGGFKEDVC
jgi:hypothetical protein